MAKILVTGGAGFIGSHLVETLVKDHEVTVLDDLSTGNLDNISAVKDKITFIEGNICDIPTIKKACQSQDYVFHLAAVVSVPFSVKHPLETHAVNLIKEHLHEHNRDTPLFAPRGDIRYFFLLYRNGQVATPSLTPFLVVPGTVFDLHSAESIGHN